MEIKLFGKSLFSAKKNSVEQVFSCAEKETKESKYLPDFYQRIGRTDILDYVILEDASLQGGAVAVPVKKGKDKKSKKIADKKEATPKGVYELKMLDETSFKLNTNAEYVDKQLTDFKEKLTMINSIEYDMRNGVEEISSIILRLENRKKYTEAKDIFEEFPYTTNSKIAEVIKEHENLQLGKIAQFIADLPKEAVDVMKKYNDGCKKICDKQAIFYIIADKKDFKKADNRRDPILLAQSPFGHVWQILGAWDKEMMFLQEL